MIVSECLINVVESKGIEESRCILVKRRGRCTKGENDTTVRGRRQCLQPHPATFSPELSVERFYAIEAVKCFEFPWSLPEPRLGIMDSSQAASSNVTGTVSNHDAEACANQQKIS